MCEDVNASAATDGYAHLESLAIVAFEAIEKNTGERLWYTANDDRHSVATAIEAFDNAVSVHGIAWLIDSTIGTGLTHMGWLAWMREARALCA